MALKDPLYFEVYFKINGSQTLKFKSVTYDDALIGL